MMEFTYAAELLDGVSAHYTQHQGQDIGVVITLWKRIIHELLGHRDTRIACAAKQCIESHYLSMTEDTVDAIFNVLWQNWVESYQTILTTPAVTSFNRFSFTCRLLTLLYTKRHTDSAQLIQRFKPYAQGSCEPLDGCFDSTHICLCFHDFLGLVKKLCQPLGQDDFDSSWDTFRGIENIICSFEICLEKSNMTLGEWPSWLTRRKLKWISNATSALRQHAADIGANTSQFEQTVGFVSFYAKHVERILTETSWGSLETESFFAGDRKVDTSEYVLESSETVLLRTITITLLRLAELVAGMLSQYTKDEHTSNTPMDLLLLEKSMKNSFLSIYSRLVQDHHDGDTDIEEDTEEVLFEALGSMLSGSDKDAFVAGHLYFKMFTEVKMLQANIKCDQRMFDTSKYLSPVRVLMQILAMFDFDEYVILEMISGGDESAVSFLSQALTVLQQYLDLGGASDKFPLEVQGTWLAVSGFFRRLHEVLSKSDRTHKISFHGLSIKLFKFLENYQKIEDQF